MVLRVTLPAETFGMTKSLSNISLEKTKKNVETILKTYELFIYGGTHVHFVKKCDKSGGF